MAKGKIIFMTGATSGFGKISAIKAAGEGATLIVLARNKVKGQTLYNEFENVYPDSKGKIEIVEGNLSSFNSVYSACEVIKSKYPVIDMIVNNAGIMNYETIKTVDNIEETLQVNLLAPVLICHLLLENLKKSNDSKVIFTSSGLHQGNIDFDNLEFNTGFSSFKVYRQSKLGVILMCKLLAKKLKSDAIGLYCQHPGVVRTNLGHSAGWFSKAIFYLMGSSPQKGSKTLSFLMDTPKVELTSGEYYADKKITITTKESYDMEVAQKLLNRANVYLNEYIKTKSIILS
jgi:NAD(P)-dependent dehydrogenase (short-subunit alcohol dehydrogenase family)